MNHRLFTGLLTASLITACSEAPPSDDQALDRIPITVAVHTLKNEQWRGQIKTFGVVEAAEEINLSLDFSGVIKTVRVNEGQRISKGQLLIELDQEKRALQLQQASESVAQAKAALDEAFLNLERRKKLAQQQIISQEVLDNAQLALSKAQAQYRETIAAQQLAQRELNDSQIYSPVNGAVDVKAVEPGENVQAGTTLLTLQAVDTLRVQTWVSEKDVSLIRNGGLAQVELTGLPGKQFSATVESVGVNAHSETGNFSVKLIIEQGSDFIRPGMTASITILGIELTNMLILPEQALVDRNRKRVVFVVNNNFATLKEPLLSAGLGNQIFILSGLTSGEQLIVSSLDSIVDGTPVAIIPQHEPSEPDTDSNSDSEPDSNSAANSDSANTTTTSNE